MVQIKSNASTILALDVGARRIGVARVHLAARFPGPLTTLSTPETFIDDIVELVRSEDVAALVVGLPRNMAGQDTDQTRTVRAFIAELEKHIAVPLYWMDEALTSAKAEAELASRKKPYPKGAVDALAATYILEDFLRDHKEFSYV